MEVRDARPEDAAAIAVVHVASWNAAYRGVIADDALDELTEERLEPEWRAEIIGPKGPGVRVVVVEDELGVAGYARIGPSRDDDLDPATDAEVYGFYVHPRAWGRGAGRVLMEHVQSELARGGFTTGVLWVVQENPRAQAFYRALGWGPDGRDDKLCIGAPEFRYRRTLEATPGR